MIFSISYPRSGITWFRYCIEFITEKPTQGNERDMPIASRDGIETLGHVDLNSEKAFYKRHWYYDNYNVNEDKIVLLIRNPLENFSREITRGGKAVEDIIKDSIPKFIKNLKGVKSFRERGGETLTVYYEDLISNSCISGVMEECVDFFPSAKKDLLDELIEDIDYHRKVSIQNYPQSYTRGEKKVKHQKRLSNSKREKVATELKEELSDELNKKYLDRYSF